MSSLQNALHVLGTDVPTLTPNAKPASHNHNGFVGAGVMAAGANVRGGVVPQVDQLAQFLHLSTETKAKLAHSSFQSLVEFRDTNTVKK